jgi:hypothetical protein
LDKETQNCGAWLNAPQFLIAESISIPIGFLEESDGMTLPADITPFILLVF